MKSRIPAWGFLSVFLVAFIPLFSAGAAESNPQLPEESSLAWNMRSSGVRVPISPEQRAETRGLYREAQARILALRMGCEAQSLHEVRLSQAGGEVIAGYEVLAYCEDSPSPSIGLYFDINYRYLRTYSLAD